MSMPPTLATTVSAISTNNPIQIPLSGNSTGTITATVTSGGNPVTLGAVSFFAGAQALATNVSLNSSGQASFTFNTVTGSPLLGEGTHVITANYSGATGFSSSTGSITQVVDRATQVTGNTFCNTGKLTMSTAANGPAAVYPSKIFVSGLSGQTQSVTLELKGFSHPFTDDVNLLLVSPTGQKFVPFAYISNLTATSNANIVLDDNAANALPTTGGIASGTYRPSHGLNGSTFNQATFPAPAPAQPYQNAAPGGSATFTSTFAGASPNGTWTLYAVNWGGTSGAGLREIANGWCLTIGTSSDPATTTTTSVTPTPSALNQSVTISALVTNSSNGSPVNAQGTVTFMEGNTVLAGPINVGSNGVASFNTSTLTQGAHTITANYSGVPGSFALSSGNTLHYVDAATTNPSALQFCNASPLTFPTVTNSSSSPYPTRINVSGLAGTINNVTLSLNGLSAAFPDDVDMMLTGPNGNSLVVLSDVGGNTTSVSNVNLVLDSTSANTLPDTAGLVSGTFRPADFTNVGADIFAAPAPTTNVFSASITTLGTAFNNSNPNGIWTLWTSLDGPGGGSLSGGWCLNFAMNQPQLTISKTHSGNFTQGQTGAQYTVTVGSSGPGNTAGTITVVDTAPAGLTITGMTGNGWSCTPGTGTCTTNAVLAANGTLPPITVTVNVATNATTPLVNSVTVSGGGATSATATDSTVINQVADLALTKTSTSSFIQGGSALYNTTVFNVGQGSTVGNNTLTDTMPTGLTLVLPVTTPNGWDCSASTSTFLNCVKSSVIPAASSATGPSFTVNIASNAPASITNTAVISGGGELNTGNNSGSATSSVTQLAPDLTISKIASGGPFQQGGIVSYALTVTNGGNGSTTGTVTVQDIIPTGLTVTSASGPNWTCTTGATVSCTATSAIAAGASSVITLNANIASNAPATITNSAAVATAGESNSGNNGGTSVISVTQIAPDLTLTKVAQGSGFQQGGTVTYDITVNNGGNGPTTGTITVQDIIPTGLTVTSATGANWTCTTGATVTCSRPTALAAGASSVITLNANIASNAPATITNSAAVATAGESNSGNNGGTSVISVTQIAPDLTLTKVAQGSGFQQGGTVTYDITVNNGGNGPTTGTITVQDIIPTGLTVTSATGANWTCTTGATVTCSRPTALAAGASSVITLNANIASNAPATITNSAAVATAGESNSGNNGVTSMISVIQLTNVTINVPAGVSYTFNGQTVTGSQTIRVAPGTYTLSTTTPQSLGTGIQAVFNNWSDAGAISHSVVVGSSALTITGNFTTQYQLTLAANPSNGGNVTPASGTFFDSGTIVNVAATANAGFVFGNWTGSVANANNAATTVTMDAAKSITANFTALTDVTVNVPTGVSYTFNGQTVTGSQTFQVVPGTYTLSTTTPQSLGAGTRAVFNNWSDAGAISHSVVVGSSALTITGSFTTQYQLTLAASPSNGGNVTPATGTFYDSGTVVNVSATANPNFAFTNWTGSVANANSAATTVTMDAPKSITANFTAFQPVTITVPAGIQFSFNGTTYTGTQTINAAPGMYTLATTSPQSLGAGTQAVFNNWSDAGAISHSVTVAASPVNISGTFKTQYQLTTAAGTGGTVTPATGNFYDAGTVVNVTATPASGYAFLNWTGPVATSASAATTVTMDAPKSITANFGLIPPFQAQIGDPFVCNGIGSSIQVTATLKNPNAGNAAASFNVNLPAMLTLVPGSCMASNGVCGPVSATQVGWTGNLAGGETLTITYQAQIADGTPLGTLITIDSVGTVAGVTATVSASDTVSCPAANLNNDPVNVALSDQKAGSVLVFPYYTSKASTKADTRLSITNVGTQQAYAHIFLLDGATCQQADYSVCITPNGSFNFKASEVDPETTGWVLVVVTDAQGRPIQNNTLVGNAFLKDGLYVGNYGAEAFWANSAQVATLNANNTATLTL